MEITCTSLHNNDKLEEDSTLELLSPNSRRKMIEQSKDPINARWLFTDKSSTNLKFSSGQGFIWDDLYFLDWESTSTGFMTRERVCLRKSTTRGTNVESIHIKSIKFIEMRVAPQSEDNHQKQRQNKRRGKLEIVISKYEALKSNNLWRHYAIRISIQSNGTLP